MDDKRLLVCTEVITSIRLDAKQEKQESGVQMTPNKSVWKHRPDRKQKHGKLLEKKNKMDVEQTRRQQII